MGSLRDHVDLAGGLRSGLTDEPPWWARGAIGAFAAMVVLVTVLSAMVGVGGGAPAGTPGGPGTAGPAATGRGWPGGPTDPPGAAAAPGAAGGTGAAGAAGEGDSSGGTLAGATDPVPGGTVALADRDGTFRQVPRAAVDAARRHGAGLLALPGDDVRHHLVGTDGERVEMAVSSLDGEREVRVVVAAVDGAWRAT